MADETPLLRADALDDELYEPVTTLEGTVLAKGGIILSGARGPGDDSVPIALHCEYKVRKDEVPDARAFGANPGDNCVIEETAYAISDEYALEPYENGQGGWSYRRVVVRQPPIPGPETTSKLDWVHEPDLPPSAAEPGYPQ